MIVFRQKEFFWNVVLPTAASLITGNQANKNQQEQADAALRQQKRMDQASLKLQKQNLEINKQLAKTANQTPESAAIALQQQKAYALTDETKNTLLNSGLPAAATLVTGAISNKTAKEDLAERAKTNMADLKIREKEVNTNQKLAESASKDPMAAAVALKNRRYSKVKEGIGFLKNLGKTAEESRIGKRIIGTAAAGALGVGAAYAVDKAIQKNAKKSGLEITNEEETEEKKALRKKNRKKRAIKLGTAAALITAGTIAAKKGAFGKDIKEEAKKINKENIKKAALKVGNYAKEGVKEIFVSKDENGKLKPNYLGIAMTAAPLAIPAYNYITSKKQYKEQLRQSNSNNYKDDEEEKTYSIKIKPKIRIKTKIDNQLGNKIFKTYLVLKSKKYSKITDWAIDKIMDARDSVISIGKNIRKTGKSFKKRPLTTTLDITSKWKGGGGRVRVDSFGRRLRDHGIKTNNKTSQNVGNFIIKHPKTSLAGSIAVGLGIARLGQLGYKKTRDFLEDHDKNAFAYEKSQGMIVPRDSKNEDDKEN